MNRRFLASMWTLVSTRKSTKLKSTYIVDVDELIDDLLDVDRAEDELNNDVEELLDNLYTGDRANYERTRMDRCRALHQSCGEHSRCRNTSKICRNRLSQRWSPLTLSCLRTGTQMSGGRLEHEIFNVFLTAVFR